MLALELLLWWYTKGWITLADKLQARIRRIYLVFSVPILLRTLFAPWKQITSHSDGSFDEKMRAVLDNVVSRFVGLGVRLTVLVAALVSVLAIGTFGAVALVAWPAVPVAGILLILRGLSL